MRILFWLRKFSSEIGGIQVLASRLLVALQKRGYEFTIVTSRTDPAQADLTEYHGIPVHHLPFQDIPSYRNIDRLIEVRRQVDKIKRTFAPDLLHIFAVGRGDFFHVTTANSHPSPVLVTLHGERLRRDTAFGRLAAQTVRGANWVTCVSQTVLTEARRTVPEVISRSSLVYNGLDMPNRVPEPLPTVKPVLLCLGRLVREKGFDLALSAFASVSARFPSLRLMVAGKGPEHFKLEQQAARLGIKNAVDFIGCVAPDDVPGLLNCITVVLMPSRYEPFGLVALDAAVMGRPIVASRVGGLSEIVIHQQTGILIEPENSAALAEAIVFLLDHPDKATQLGQAARERARSEFSWRRCIDGYDALYQRLCKRAVHGLLRESPADPPLQY
jgi:glycogen(starch) synthase